jgi:hypothetical protein
VRELHYGRKTKHEEQIDRVARLNIHLAWARNPLIVLYNDGMRIECGNERLSEWSERE